MPISAICGLQLSELFASGYIDELAPYIAESPMIARRRIAEQWGKPLSLSGGNIPGIAQIRDELRLASSRQDSLHGLVITAPHTHWSNGLPILIGFTGSAYLLGEQEPHADAVYRPVSFVLTERGARPYEWLDPSVAVANDELEMLWDIVAKVAEKLRFNSFPLGLSLNYRFKQFLEPGRIPTVEFQGVGPASGTDMCVILRSQDAEPEDLGDLEQVTWHAFADPSDFTDDQYRLLAIMRELADAATDSRFRQDPFAAGTSRADLTELLSI